MGEGDNSNFCSLPIKFLSNGVKNEVPWTTHTNVNHRNPLTTLHEPPYPTNSPHEPLGGLDSYFRLYIYLYVCICVSRHPGHTIQVRDLYSCIYTLHIDEKNRFFGFFEKIFFSIFFCLFFTFKDRISILSWCMVYCGYTYILGYRAYFCFDFGL